MPSADIRASENWRRRHPSELSRMYAFVHPKALLTLTKEAFSQWGTHNVPRMSAALAYYTIFSLAPVLIIVIAVAGLVFGQKAAQGAVIAQTQQFLGQDNAKAVQNLLKSAHRPVGGGIASGIAILLLIIGAAGVFGEIRDALNTIWNVTPPKRRVWSMVRQEFLSFGMVLVIGFLLLVSLVISAALTAVAKYVGGSLPIPPFVLHWMDLLISLAIVTALFAMMFKMLPDVKIAWSDVWIGAGLTSLLFTMGKFLIGFYIGKTVSASAYGAAGSLVTIVAWIYYSAFILYFGAEFTRTYAMKFGSHAGRAAD
jgi:membrane protein